MAVPLPDAREVADEVRDALRLRALRGRAPGPTEVAAAQLPGLSRETASRWWPA
jgi:hypothetical protein